jgi:hypothetical protein
VPVIGAVTPRYQPELIRSATFQAFPGRQVLLILKDTQELLIKRSVNAD